jgi:3-oxoacyl-[acyl-carrier protein] reductase
LITGASKGIGGAAAEMLAAEGCHLVLVARTAGDLARAKESIARKANVSIETVPVDLSVSASVTRLAREFPGIDILVNNAGAIPGGKLLDIDEATWRAAWDLKVFGYINMCRAFYTLMKARHAGVIINVIGNAAQTHDPDYICGVTGNAALTAFTQSLGSVSVRDGVRVVAVSPGPVATGRLVNLMRRRRRTAPATRRTGVTCLSRCRSNAPPPRRRSEPRSRFSLPSTLATLAARSPSLTLACRRARKLSEHRAREEAVQTVVPLVRPAPA